MGPRRGSSAKTRTDEDVLLLIFVMEVLGNTSNWVMKIYLFLTQKRFRLFPRKNCQIISGIFFDSTDFILHNFLIFLLSNFSKTRARIIPGKTQDTKLDYRYVRTPCRTYCKPPRTYRVSSSQQKFESGWIRLILTLGIRVEPPTSTISSTSDSLRSASFITFWTGPRVFLNRSMFSCLYHQYRATTRERETKIGRDKKRRVK